MYIKINRNYFTNILFYLIITLINIYKYIVLLLVYLKSKFLAKLLITRQYNSCFKQLLCIKISWIDKSNFYKLNLFFKHYSFEKSLSFTYMSFKSSIKT